MKTRTSSNLALLLGLILLEAPCADGSPADAAREVEALERELVAAIRKGDLAAYDRIVADDYVVFDAAGGQLTKAEVLESYRKGTRRYTGLEIFDVVARVFGDTAVVAAKTKGMRREGDRDVPNRVRYLRVFARRDGRWRAVCQMAAPGPDRDDGDPPGRRLPPGSWGGEHIGMEISERGAKIEYDCAHGSIDEPIRLDEKADSSSGARTSRQGSPKFFRELSFR